MEEKNISITKIKALLSMISMALLAIQHFVGLFVDDISISYIPLSVTFLTIFIGSMEASKEKGIRIVSLIATVLIILAGVIIYNIQSYDINMNEKCFAFYLKGMFSCIGGLSLILSVLYIKRIIELE